VSMHDPLDVKVDCKCDDCGMRVPPDDLKPIHDLFDRLSAGGVVPAGECPNCGALCYPMSEAELSADRFLQIARNKTGAKKDDDLCMTFDELVHDLASKQASNVNNGGARAQALFIIEQCGLNGALGLLPKRRR